MKYTANKIHRRKNLLLKGHDYSRPGYYFITICTQHRFNLSGDVVNGVMVLNDAGKTIDKWWKELENKYNNIELHNYIIMPDHMHGIIRIMENNSTSGIYRSRSCCIRHVFHMPSHRGGHAGPPLWEIIQWFKTMTTNEYIRGVRNNNWQPFDRKLWQRKYYVVIIHSRKSYTRISEYINNNPQNYINMKH